MDTKELLEKMRQQRRQAEEADAERRAISLGFPYLNLVSAKVPTELKAMALVPEAEARAAFLVPLQLVRKDLTVAALDPHRPETKAVIDRLGETYTVTVAVCSLSGLEHAWAFYRYVGKESHEISGRIEIDKARLTKLQEEIRTLDNLRRSIHDFKSPLTTELLEVVLGGAIALAASDVHLEPGETSGALRVRMDGVLHSATDELPLHAYNSIITRIKLLSNLKLNIHDQAQDGRFTVSLSDRDIEVRTSIIPSEYGETVVLRLLDPHALKVNLEDLGWRPDDLEIVKQVLREPNGLILNTGPTGSGKTTTLYAFLQNIFSPEIKIITVEDPIEYHIAGISQTQVDAEAGYTFANGLRSILRQDPDVILVGEIRDAETADIAMNASLTGHLVFSTLHTNDAVGAIPRLLDLGAKPQILGPALSLVIAQRLVRILCPHCRVPVPLTKEWEGRVSTFLSSLPSRADAGHFKNATLFEAKGCEMCGGIGYRGRTSIFELFLVSDVIEQAIYRNPTEIELKDLARKQGMTTMQEDGVLKVFQGITTFKEVEDVTGPLVWPKGERS